MKWLQRRRWARERARLERGIYEIREALAHPPVAMAMPAYMLKQAQRIEQELAARLPPDGRDRFPDYWCEYCRSFHNVLTPHVEG